MSNEQRKPLLVSDDEQNDNRYVIYQLFRLSRQSLIFRGHLLFSFAVKIIFFHHFRVVSVVARMVLAVFFFFRMV